jgi:hypothetical protein
LPEDKDVNKTIIKVNRNPGKKDLYEGIGSHYESERNEDREGGPEAPMRDRTGPIVLTPSTYVDEDKEFDRKKRRASGKNKKK